MSNLGGLFFLISGIIGTSFIHPVQANQILADLSEHFIAVTTGFTGTNVTLFGAIDGPGSVVAVIRGPDEMLTIRQKNRIFGLWINRASMNFVDVPSYYRWAASAPLDQILLPELTVHNQIGLKALPLLVDPDSDSVAKTVAEFREALIRRQQARGLYGLAAEPIQLIGDRLFRYTIDFPSNVPIGEYTVTIFHIHDGMVSSLITTPLRVSKTGASAWIYRFAHQFSGLYGLMALVISVSAGWGAGVIFRKA